MNPECFALRLTWKISLKVGIVAALATIAITPLTGMGLFQNSYPHLPPELNRIPDSNQSDDINAQQRQRKSFEAVNAERKKQLVEDSTKLLKLATDLKAELEKTDKDTLSISAIRKADEIEKLARSLKEKMKLTVGPG